MLLFLVMDAKDERDVLKYGVDFVIMFDQAALRTRSVLNCLEVVSKKND